MTVGAGSGSNSGQQAKIEQSEQMEATALRQLKEFYGGNLKDDIGRQALRCAKTTTGHYDVQFAMNWLLDHNVSSTGSQQPPPNSSAGTGQGASSTYATAAKATPKTLVKESETAKVDGRQKTPGANEDTDMQKAIALSLSEQPLQPGQQQQTPLGLGGQISAEEQELSRVIEASIAESKKGVSHDLRQSSLFFVDPANPRERERQGTWPVGLKNVGNTCWFSVVIQALFHLPIFRRRLLNYDLDAALHQFTPMEAAASSSAPASSTVPREVEFASELRKLFALLLASHRKYVDPSFVVDVLRKQDSLQLRNIGGMDSGQQDVSEFTHLLLEWLEEAFKVALPAVDNAGAAAKPKEAQDDGAMQKMDIDVISPKDNAIDQLFYGLFLKESTFTPHVTAETAESRSVDDASAGLDVQMVPTAKEERFSQYPLQVTGCETLHDSMEKSLRPEDSPDIEHWLERLPPVLLFELTRFQYNKTDKKPEKIHSKFRFPKVLYVDRYLRGNKVVIREKRIHVSRLREQLNALKYELEKLENFRGSKMPLANVLTLTLDFIGRGDDTRSTSCETEPMDGCEPATADATGDSLAVQPFLRHAVDISDTELEIMDRCMNRWRGQVLQRVEELKLKISEVEEQIDRVYVEPQFQQHPYALHAVLVHEGQATVGHYWTFINEPHTDKWCKYNDVQVSEVSFEEVERDSFGDYQSTSAYCLVYVDAHRRDLFERTDLRSLTESELMASLPPDLQRFVSNDNLHFSKELDDWDRKHATTPSAPTPSPTGGAPAAAQRVPVQGGISEVDLANLVEENGRLCARDVRTFVQSQLESLRQDAMSLKPEMLLNKLIEEKIATTKRSADEFLSRITFTDNGNNAHRPNWHACIDARIREWLPFYSYCWMRCGGGKHPQLKTHDENLVLRRHVLDYFANPHLVVPNGADPMAEKMTEIYQIAKRSISSVGALPAAELEVYARIYCNYQTYKQTLILLAHALEKLRVGNYIPALQGIICTKTYADRLSSESLGAGGVDYDFVLGCFRVICVNLSDQILKEILSTTNDAEVVEKIKILKTQLLPCLIELHHQHHDSGTLEAVRAGWFASVVDERNVLPELKFREMKDFLDALMEVETAPGDGRSKPPMTARIRLQPDFGVQFEKALNVAREFSIIQCDHGFDGENQTSGLTASPTSNK